MLQKKANAWPVLAGIALAAGFSLWVLLDTLHIPLLDQHSFRQTQTAITAFWMTKNFSLLNYETPILGMPWAIPFEFPLYQALVALLWKLFPSLSMDAAARVVSFATWGACAYPIHRIMMRYFHDIMASGILLCLFFSSPFSIFWARTAMIETTVLLCSLMFLWQIIRLGDAPTWRTADARMEPLTLRKGYGGQLDSFCEVKARWDPQNKFLSLQAKRLGLGQAGV